MTFLRNGNVLLPNPLKGTSMKNFLSFLTGILLLSASAFSQTEIWRLWRPIGSFEVAAQDGQGDTYVSLKSAAGSLDSLAKVGPDGTILWQQSIPARDHKLLPTVNGVYVSPPLYGNGPVYYYDANGNYLWSFSFPDRSFFASFPAVTQDGGIILAYSTAPPPQGDVGFNPLNSTLVKLNAAGERVFEVTIPTVVPNARQQYVFGPSMTSDGNPWVLAQAKSEQDMTQRPSPAFRGFGFDEAMLFNGTTGQLITRKNVYQGVIEDWKNNADGSSKSFILNTASYGGPAKFITTSGTNLVVGGYWDAQTTKCRKNGECTFVSKSEWRMSIVSPTGTVSSFRYRGGGEVRTVDAQTIEKTDDSSNELLEVMAGPNDDLYLHGTVGRGKTADGINDFAYHDLLMKYNIATKKAAWKIMTPGGQSMMSTVLHPSSNVLLRQSDGYSMNVFDLTGAVGGTMLRFSDPVSLIGTEHHGVYYIPFTESGTVVLRGFGAMVNPGQPFIAKYSIASALASQSYTARATTEDLTVSESYTLQQNYPNPFNPSTTIEFELPNDAVVTVKIFNSLGQEIATLAEREEFSAGPNELEFNADGLTSGVYFYRLSAVLTEAPGTPFTQMKKMVLMK